jgi:streptogramin lyase
MTSNTMLFITILTIFSSCNGIDNAQIADSTLNDSTAIPKASKAFGTIGEPVSEIDNCIWGIFQDNNNNYWFGSGDGQGVYRYDGKTILHFTGKDGLCDDKIWKIEGDKSGNIYFTTVEGCISKFDGKAFSTLSITGNSTNEWKLEPDDLWFKSAQDSGVVYRYDGKLLHRLEFPKTKLGDEYIIAHPRSKYPNMPYSPYDVYTIYKDTKGNVWFGTGTLGVCRYDGKSFAWITEDDVTELDDGPSNGVRSIIEDKDGYFWFSNTLFRYNILENNLSAHLPDERGNSVIDYRRVKGIGSLDGKDKGNLDYFMSIVKDNNDLWIAMYGAGVWRYDGKNISHYPIKNGNATVWLFSIYKDNQGDLWLGTHDGGAYRFNGKAFEKFRP